MEERRKKCFTLPLTGLLNTRVLGIFKRNNPWSFTQETLRMLRCFGPLLPKTSDPAANSAVEESSILRTRRQRGGSTAGLGMTKQPVCCEVSKEFLIPFVQLNSHTQASELWMCRGAQPITSLSLQQGFCKGKALPLTRNLTSLKQ